MFSEISKQVLDVLSYRLKNKRKNVIFSFSRKSFASQQIHQIIYFDFFERSFYFLIQTTHHILQDLFLLGFFKLMTAKEELYHVSLVISLEETVNIIRKLEEINIIYQSVIFHQKHVKILQIFNMRENVDSIFRRVIKGIIYHQFNIHVLN